MAIENPPWMVAGAEHPVEVARLLAYVGSSGAEGVVGVTDMRVQAEAVPGASVRVLSGAAVILNKYAGGGQQSYMMRVPTQTSVNIVATGSGGGRTDLIVARILDPGYEGQPAADPNSFEYARLTVIQGVPASTTSATQLGLTYPAIALAKVTLPASTGTVTAGMITDLREVANPRVRDVTRPKASVGGDAEILVAVRDNGEWFPNGGGEQQIFIPEWATRMQIRAEWFQIEISPGAAYGQHWVEFGPGGQDRAYGTQRFQWDTANANNIYRESWACVDDVYVPAALRGTTQTFVMKARRGNGTAANTVRLTPLSGTNLQVRFMEVADSSDS